MATPTSITTKTASRPPVLALLTYRFIFCRVEPFTLYFASSLFHHSPISCSLSLLFSLPLSPFSSLVVRIHPTAEWLLCLCVYAHRGSLSVWTPPSLCYYSLICSYSFCRQHVCWHTRMPQVACFLLAHEMEFRKCPYLNLFFTN